jgi:PIN domain nuclease of toxin-antitoxin system
MRLLIDSHALIWARQGNVALSTTARGAIEDPDNTAFFSHASLWELTIKIALGRLVLPERVETSVALLDLEFLPIRVDHIRQLETLPRLHRDPFDRMLVAQALIEGLTLVSGDRQLAAYPVPTLW